MHTLPPQAEKGKSVRQAWDALVKWARGTAILSGPGVRISRSAGGTTVSFHAPRQSFRGAFRVNVSGGKATVGVGTINGAEPTINGVKIGGEKGKPIPSIILRPAKYDDEGRSWICAVVKVTAAGKIDAAARDAITIVQTDHPTKALEDGRPVAPLAMLRRADPKGTDFGELYQVAFFNLNMWGTGTDARFFFAP